MTGEESECELGGEGGDSCRRGGEVKGNSRVFETVCVERSSKRRTVTDHMRVLVGFSDVAEIHVTEFCVCISFY